MNPLATWHSPESALDTALYLALSDPDTARHLATGATLSTDHATRRAAVALLEAL